MLFLFKKLCDYLEEELTLSPEVMWESSLLAQKLDPY